MLTTSAQLPWLSVPEEPFPSRAPHRRRNGRSLQISAISVELPAKETQRKDNLLCEQVQDPLPAPVSSEPQTPITSHAPSETDSTHPTTPSSAAPTHAPARSQNQVQSQVKTSKPAVPLVPVVPIFPQSPSTPRQLPKETQGQTSSAAPDSVVDADSSAAETVTEEPAESSATAAEKPVSPTRVAPKSWADLVRSKTQPRGARQAAGSSAESGGPSAPRSESLVDVLNSLGPDVDQYGEKIAFLEPRGLVNTGNMCYMNSVSYISQSMRLISMTDGAFTGASNSGFLCAFLSIP